MENTGLVYCRDCKHVMVTGVFVKKLKCSVLVNINYGSGKKKYRICEMINSKGDCKKYQPK